MEFEQYYKTYDSKFISLLNPDLVIIGDITNLTFVGTGLTYRCDSNGAEVKLGVVNGQYIPTIDYWNSTEDAVPCNDIANTYYQDDR